MTTTKKFLVYGLMIAAVTLGSGNAWAIYSPEPQSGGRFFPSKGTRAAEDYTVSTESYDSSLSKTEEGAFDQQYYGKGLNIGNAKLLPSASYVGEYDSNIFLEEGGTDDDYISRLLFGLDGYAPFEGNKYALFGGVHNETEFFANHHGENHTDWTYQLGGSANFNSVNVSVFDQFKDTSERSDNELTQRIQRYENYLDGLINIPFGQFFSETEISDFNLNFSGNDDFQGFDRHEFAVYPRLGFDLTPRTQALLEYGFINIYYPNKDDRDAVVNQIQAGLRGFLGKGDLLSYQVWGGFQFRHYHESDALTDFNGFVGHGQLVYKPSEIQQFIVEAIRRPEESLESNQTFYVRNDVGIRYRRQIAESWYANARFGFGFNHYNSNRLDFIWEPSAGIEYVLPGKILALFTEYKFSARNSDADGRDYKRHIADFGIRAAV